MKIKPFYRDTWAEINLDCIHDNVVAMQHHIGENIEIIAVVKANAYGHGDIQVAKTAIKAGASRLAVAILDEALRLRKAGITAPIHVLGAVRPEDVEMAAKNNITLTVFQLDWFIQAQKLYSLDIPVTLHLKLDTGMGRIGVTKKEDVQKIEKMIQNDKRFLLEGVFTHFATADVLDTTYFQTQYLLFLDMLDWFSEKPPLIHCSNSATALRFPMKVFNAVRFGISMYGLSPSQEIKAGLPFPLKEAFSLHSRLTHVKQVKEGTKISYGATYSASSDEWIGTIPIGYADGWLRRLSGFHVLIEGEKVPIVGRICMDQCMVRLNKEVPVGTKVTLIGKQLGQRISVDDVAIYSDTINYEIPCLISLRVPRMFLKNLSIIEVSNFTY